MAGQIQGRLMKEWGADEFKHVLAMVNNPQDAMKAKSIDPFLCKVTNKENPNQQSNKTEKLEKKIMVDSPQEKTFSMIKNHLSNLEADFVIYKENINDTMKDLKQTIDRKDEEISSLKKEILSLKSLDKDKQQTIGDLTLKQLQMEDEICSIHKEHKKLQDKNTNLIKSVLKKQDELETNINVSTSTCNDETPTWASMSSLPPHIWSKHLTTLSY